MSTENQPAVSSAIARTRERFAAEREEQEASGICAPDAEDLSNRVWYNNLFVESTQKDTITPAQNNGNSSNIIDFDTPYLSALGRRRNPDILMPEGSFLQGKKYKRFTSDEPDETAKNEDSGSEEGELETVDEFAKLKKQQPRYYIEQNCTVKCFNCKEHGHYARECPNKRKEEICLLCGKYGHNSFECYEKLCFKCNKAGHEIRDCLAENVSKCSKCNMLGH